MRSIPLLTTFLTALLLTATAKAQVPAPEEIQSSINEGNYKDALQKISSALAVRGDAGKNVERARLYMLKAECHLRMKAPTLAAEAYGAAAKEAKDDKARNLAAAHQLLMQRQRGLAYRAVTSAKGAVPLTHDVIEPASRTKAFGALLADELAALQPKLAAAKKSTGLAPIFEAFKLIPRLEGIELAAAGDSPQAQAPQTQKLLTELSDQSRKLIDAALKEMNRHVVAVDKEANQYQEIVREVPDPTVRSAYGVRYKREIVYKKKGPNDVHLRELQQLATTCEQIEQASKMIAGGVPTQAKAFEPLVGESERIRKEAARILDADYTAIYKDLPTRPKPDGGIAPPRR
jgi:hypothetical protein